LDLFDNSLKTMIANVHKLHHVMVRLVLDPLTIETVLMLVF